MPNLNPPQPTLFEAVSRHRILVLIMAVLGLVAGAAYALEAGEGI